jgi:LacI family transcriptional regulator
MTDTAVEPAAVRVRACAPTLHGVAVAAGVSLATASWVLNGSTRTVAESYRERVEAAAQQLGYSANLSAQATAKGTSAIIALLVAEIADPHFGLLASGVAGADEAGLVVTIAITERDAAREIRVVRALRGQRPRGLILAASQSGETSAAELQHELEALAAGGGRVVALGPGAGDVRTVLIDNIGGSRALGAALAQRGYRRAIILGAQEGVRTSDDRIAGFTEGFASGGGSIDRVHRGAFTPKRESARCATPLPTASTRAPSSSGSAMSSPWVHCRPPASRGLRSGSTSRWQASTTSRRDVT